MRQPAHKKYQSTPVLSKKMQQALASLGLEGIELSAEALADLQLFEEGKLSKEEALKRALARAKS